MTRREIVMCALLAVALVAGLVVPGRLAERPTPPEPLVGGWVGYVAPESSCPGRRDAVAPPAVQERTMLCLVNWARTRGGRAPLRTLPTLMRSAELKAADIAGCRQFSHRACGKTPDATFRAAGYGARISGVGENIAWGVGLAGSPADVLNGWLNSAEHRANLFRPDWTEQGIALVTRSRFRGSANARIWVSHFGYRR